ncbi:MAG: Type 1 glutamine amidotransferase-like domain-containing protein, partial [Candidatus Eremiobacteraeota bacterium]|nr:Type 1 glutamine amidotransferase-like domain-containing protein [Candidatus Eremiobacteraeota bacterium]
MPTVADRPHYTYYHRGSVQDIQTPTRGGVALMGGSTDVDEVFTWMADQGGNGDFLVLRGSGSDGYQEYIEEIADVNSVSTLVIEDAEAAHDPFVVEQVQKAEAVFFAGGDQWNYVGKWKDSPLLAELNKSLARGVPMGGTSAGLAILGEHVFTAEKNTIDSEDALQ